MKFLDIYNTLERLSNLMRNEMRKEGGRFGLQPVQLEALHYLSICNRYSDTPKAVTDYLGQTKGTVSQSLKILERDGLIEKCIDLKDKRVTHLKLSLKGKEILHQAIPGEIWTELKTSEILNETEQKQIGTILQSLLKALQQANNFKRFGVCKTCRYNKSLGQDRFHCQLTNESLSVIEVEKICAEHEKY